MDEFLNYLLPSIGSGALMTFVTHFITKKKYTQEVNLARAEAQGKELDNVEKAAKIWRELSEQMKENFDTEIKSFHKTVDDLNAQVESLNVQVESLKKELIATKEALRQSDIKNSELSKQLKLYNQNLKSHESASNR